MKDVTDADFWIDHLGLTEHPEGGYFKEIYRSSETIQKNALPKEYENDRAFCTSIYFLLKEKQTSAFHRLRSDEIWHFYKGSSLTIYIIEKNRNLKIIKLGNNPLNGEVLQFVIEKNQWFGAEVNDKNSYSLIGCTVSPGFDFHDFELGNTENLLKEPARLRHILQMIIQESTILQI